MSDPGLYSISCSPPSWRVMPALTLKGVPSVLRSCDHETGENKPRAYLAIIPQGQALIVTLCDALISESFEILAWFDRSCGQRLIWGQDPHSAARICKDVMLMEGDLRPAETTNAQWCLWDRPVSEEDRDGLLSVGDGLAEKLETKDFPGGAALTAEVPATYHAYLQTFRIFAVQTTRSPLKQQVVMEAANHESRCHHCTAGHSILMQTSHLPDDVIEALQDGTFIAGPKLKARRIFARALIESRGHVGGACLQAILDAGTTTSVALEVLAGLATKLLSNFTKALAPTELDDPVKSLTWTHPADRAA